MYNLLTVEGKNLAPLYSHFDLLSRPPTAGLNTQGLCNPGRITVEGKNLAPLYSHVDFPSPPPSPPALILLCVMAQGLPKENKNDTVIVFRTRSNIKAGGEGAAYLPVAMPEYSGARFLLSTVRRFYMCTSSTGLHVYAHTLTRSRLPGILPVRLESFRPESFRPE